MGGSQPSEKGAKGHTKNQIAFDRRLFASNISFSFARPNKCCIGNQHKFCSASVILKKFK